MERITSTTNEIVKEAAKLQQRKYREHSGHFLAEGEKAVKGLFCAGFKLVELFVKEETDIFCEKTYLVNEAVLGKISTTKSPSAIIGVFEQKKYNLKHFLGLKKLLLLENIKDAGNLGTVLRSCKAFDIEGVLLLGDTIDLYNPKVVRASVGCFDIPVLNIDYFDLKEFSSHYIYSTALYENSIPLNNVEFKKPMIISFGSEADGLSEKFLATTETQKCQNVKIETSGNVESLNLASAVSICLHKIYLG